MKKYILLTSVLAFLAITSAAEIELSNPKAQIQRIVNLDPITTIVKNFFDLLDVTETTYSGFGGQCVRVNSGETGLEFGNCSNATGGGAGDITSVVGDEWITNGSVTGAVNLIFNDSQLDAFVNSSIDDRAETERLDGLFVNYTSVTTTGNITNGSLVGYEAADSLCNDDYPGSHMCQMHEVINSVRLRGVSNFTTTFRVSEGAPGFTTNANDCVGWRDDTGSYLGSIWVGNSNNGGQGALVACNAERPIGCCI